MATAVETDQENEARFDRVYYCDDIAKPVGFREVGLSLAWSALRKHYLPKYTVFRAWPLWSLLECQVRGRKVMERETAD